MKRLLLPACLALMLGRGLAQPPVRPADSIQTLLKAHPGEDSVRVKLLIDLIKAVIYTAPDEAMKYSDEILRISGKLDWRSGIAFGYAASFILCEETAGIRKPLSLPDGLF